MILSLDQLRSDYKKIRKSHDTIAFRLDALIAFTKIEIEFLSYRRQDGKAARKEQLANSLKVSDRSLYRWKSLYRKSGYEGLRPVKNEGRKAIELPDNIKTLIENYRKTKRWGSEVIQAHLRLDHDFDTSKFRIERFLNNSGLRDKYPCTTKKRQKLKKKKHTKVVKVDNPGDHTQMDVKYLPHLLPYKKKCYVYNFIDHASNWSYKKVYSRISVANTQDFMMSLLEICPFNIRRLQTDNGIEFTYKWVSQNADDPKPHTLEKICEENEIVHKLIPPAEKELQGLVERSHRQDDQEFYSNVSPNSLEEFSEQLEFYYKHRNSQRRFKKLSWRTPNWYLENFTVCHIAYGWYMMDKILSKQAEVLANNNWKNLAA